MLEAAHQAAADAGDLCGIQGQVLFFRHLDGDRHKLGKMRMTAQASSADSDASQNLRLIPDSDLTQLNSRTEHTGQILNQLPEIDPSVRRKVKQHFIVIKRILCLNQFHLQAVLFDFFLTDPERFPLLDPVGSFLRVILRSRDPDHRLERLHNLFILYLFCTDHNASILHASGRLHNHMLPSGNIQLSGREVIDFPRSPESDAYDLFHVNSPLSSA